MINKEKVIEQLNYEISKPWCWWVMYELYQGYGIYYKTTWENVVPEWNVIVAKVWVIMEWFWSIMEARRWIRRQNKD